MFIPMKTKDLNCALENMTPESIGQAADILRTLAHPARLRIVDALNTSGGLPVSQITEYLGLTQSATSQHLIHMRRVGLLKTERRGKEVWYSIADVRPIALLNCICSCCDRNE
jgi:DNA-binding transcriptional ArsR family regulator